MLHATQPSCTLIIQHLSITVLQISMHPIQISAEIMQIHHTKHHAAYVANFNIAKVKLEEATFKGDISTIISMQQAIKFNGGGHLNHSIFWKNLQPISAGGGYLPPGDLRTLIEAQYGSLENLQAAVTASTVGVQGSGWGKFDEIIVHELF